MSQTMIRIEGLTKSFGATQALRGLSFEVSKGQVVGFLGPNGAGKSTTMKILAGFLAPTAGKAFVGGLDVGVDPVATRRMIGYLPENNPLYEEMMVLDFLGFVAEVRQVPAEKRAERIRTAVDRCGLKTVLGKDIGQLSKGFRQRVGLAQAILHDPDLLILEPETGEQDSPKRAIAPNGQSGYATGDSEQPEISGQHRFRDEMLGDPQRGLSVDEVADLTDLSPNTVRAYLSDERRKKLGDKIRSSPEARDKALRIVRGRRSQMNTAD